MKDMPVIFVGHGSPLNIAEENTFTKNWGEMAAKIPKPEAILCVSAHWYNAGNAVSSVEQPDTIYDFYGFPEELYEVEYPAPGAPALAKQVACLLKDNIQVEPHRGLDHGTWSVLHFMYPQADIPTCQLMVNAVNSPLENYRTGQMLRTLRKKGVLIVGSGNIVHNLPAVEWDMLDGYPWANEFDAYIKDAVQNGDHEDVINYRKAGPSSLSAFVYRDHFDPLLYALGATERGENIQVYNNSRVMGSVSMTSYIIG